MFNKKLVSNIKYLTLMQIGNYLLPLITIPYILRVIDIEKFGLISFVSAVIVYFSIVVDYGFNLVATSEVSRFRSFYKRRNELFWHVMFIKLIIVLVMFFVLIVSIYTIPFFKGDINLYIYGYGVVIGEFLFPLWFFQGMEDLKYVAIINIISKLIFTLLVFIFVKQQSDYELIVLFNSLGYIVAGAISFIIVIKKYNLKLITLNYKKLIIYFKRSWNVFLANILVKLYSNINIILLGVFTNNIVVGYYSLVQKILGAISGLFLPFSQSFFPRLASLAKVDYKNNLKNIIKFYIILSSVLFLVIILFGEEIIYLISGKYSDEVYKILLLMSILIFTSPLGTLFSQHFIINKKMQYYLSIMKYTLLTNFILVLLFLPNNKIYGMGYAILITQIVHMLLNIYYYKKA